MTVLKRGAAPVDEHSGMVDTHQVLSTPEGVWDAMLNQTDLGKNANKCAFFACFVVLAVSDALYAGSTCCSYCTQSGTRTPASSSRAGAVWVSADSASRRYASHWVWVMTPLTCIARSSGPVGFLHRSL